MQPCTGSRRRVSHEPLQTRSQRQQAGAVSASGSALPGSTTWTRALQWAIVGCIGFGFLYSVIARIDEVVIAGRTQRHWRRAPIKAPIAGVVSAIPISEGQLVTPGQVLVQFDPDVNEERLRSLQGKRTSRVKDSQRKHRPLKQN